MLREETGAPELKKWAREPAWAWGQQGWGIPTGFPRQDTQQDESLLSSWLMDLLPLAVSYLSKLQA